MPDFDKTQQPHPQPPPAGHQGGYQPGSQATYAAGPAPKRLVRSSTDSWISGVCGGIGDYLGIDANLVRLGFVVGTVLGFGTFLIGYVIAWALMPKA